MELAPGPRRKNLGIKTNTKNETTNTKTLDGRGGARSGYAIVIFCVRDWQIEVALLGKSVF